MFDFFLLSLYDEPEYESWRSGLILCTGNPLTGTLSNSEDPDEIQHNAAFHQGLHRLLRLKQSSGTEIHQNLEKSTCDPLKNTMSCLMLIALIGVGKTHRDTKGYHRKKIPYDLHSCLQAKCEESSENIWQTKLS